MEENVKILVDVSAGTKTVVPLTEEEIAEKQAQIAAAEARRLEAAQAALDKEAAKQSALSKLQALGLTEDEAKALVGA